MEPRWLSDEGSDPSQRYPDVVRGLSLPAVTENGEERIRPDVMAFLMQAAQAGHLARMRYLEESKVPTGAQSIDRTITKFTKIIRESGARAD